MARTEQSILIGVRSAATLALALFLGSCSSTPSGPPRNAGNICSIFDEFPEWRDATVASATRWGAPVEIQMAIMWRESSFRHDAQPPKDYALGFIPWGRVSSAYGYSQAIDGTWNWYREETGNSGADRDDFEDAADFVGWYMAKTRATNGLPMHDAFNQYLAYHEGHTGYRRGNWRSKTWLVGAAKQVAARAQTYRALLTSC